MAHPLAPNDVIEKAKSGRSSCRACRKKIDAGTPRYGMAIESYDDEIAHIWFHLACGASDARGRFQVVYDKYKDQIPELASIYTPGATKTASTFPYIEVAPTGRSKCIKCDTTIAKGEERVAIERTIEVNGFSRTGPGYFHLTCAEAALVAEARSKGSAPKVVPAAAPPAVMVAKKPAAPRQDFELAIIENPDDPAPYLVWADALQTTNDPLGALIVAASAKKGVFTAAFKKHKKALLGDAVLKAMDDGELEFEWKNGVVHSLSVFISDNGRDDEPAVRAAAVMTQALSRPALRFVREVTASVGRDYYERDPDLELLGWVLEPLAKAAPPVLQTLTLGSDEESCSIGGLHQVFAACPKLEKLTLFGDAISWGKIEGSGVKEIHFIGDLTLDVIKAFATLPKLTRLELDVVRSHAEPKPFAEAMAGFQSLQAFTLRDYVQADVFTELLAKSSILPKLRALTLTGNVAAKGIAALTANVAALKNCEVTLEGTKVSKSALDAFKKAKKKG